MPQTWGVQSSLINVNELNDFVLHQSQNMLGFQQIANPPSGKAIGLGAGDTVQLTYFPNVSRAGGRLNENERVPRTSLTPVKTTYTLLEFGNAVDWTGTYEAFARLEPEDVFMTALVDDLRKLENYECYTACTGTHWKAVFASAGFEFVTNNTPTATMNQHPTRDNLRQLVRRAKSNNIPYYDGESYVFITGNIGADALAYDDDIVTSLNEDSGRSALNGEIGRVVQCRVVEDNYSITQKNTSYDECFLVGADAIINDVAMPWEIRDEVDDFFRQMSIAYLSYGVWHKIYNQTSHSREHVIHVTSA